MKRKFNIFDVIIIAAVVVVLLLGYKMFTKTTETATSSANSITFTVEIANVENDLYDRVKIGDDVYDSVKGGYYGKVVNVDKKTYSSTAANSKTGKYDLVEYPKKNNIYVTIEGTPTSVTDANIQFASQCVKVGTQAFLKTKNYVGYGYVVDMYLE